MDDQRFDQLTRAWAGIHSRRRLVGALVASTGAGVLSGFGLRRRTLAQEGCAEGLTACGEVCADILNDVENCGGCGLLCPGEAGRIACASGVCVTLGCPVGTADCGDYCADTQNDPDNCGACGNVCPGEAGTVSCVGGSCVDNDGGDGCPEGQIDCGGFCADTANDIENCGDCGVVCTSEAGDVICAEGECFEAGCADGLTDCGVVCADIASDIENCGACGNVCTSESGEVACIDGACVDTSCADGLTSCGDLCVDTFSDLDNCGGCGLVCASDETEVACIAGECIEVGCPPGLEDCGDFCADALTDSNNCGACFNVCASGICDDGVCVDPPTPTPVPTEPPAETPTEPPAESPTPTDTPAALPADDAVGTPSAARCPTTTEDENETIVRRWHEDVLTLGNANALNEILNPDVVYHAGTRPDLDTAAAVAAELDDILVSFPDVRVDIEQAITEDDTVVIRWTATGTNDGPLDGLPPTGRTISWTGIDIFRIDCGRIAEVWTEVDRRGQEQQLTRGGTPTPTA